MAATAGKPWAEGLAAERALLLDPRAGVESKALRRLFLARQGRFSLPHAPMIRNRYVSELLNSPNIATENAPEKVRSNIPYRLANAGICEVLDASQPLDERRRLL